ALAGGGVSLSARVGVQLGTLDLDLELEVADGELLAVLGPNGAGKTTLLRALAGLLPLQRGRVVLDGTVYEDVETGLRLAPERRACGVVFQDYLLFPHLSALENVAFGLRSRGIGRRQARPRAAEWQGRLVQSGTPAEVTAHPRSRYVADLVGVNLVRGRASGGVVQLAAGGSVAVADSIEGDVFAVIHPRAVALHRQRPEGTPRNVWPGQAAGVDLLGDRARVRVEGELPLVAEVTPAAVAELALAGG